MYIADLHIHSKYSRATSRDCEPEALDLWSRRKGIDLLGTGDFTHPAWRAQLNDKLEPAEDGLYVLKEEYRISDEITSGEKKPRFVISGEISSIYKKNGKTRKVHNLILLPGLEAAEALSCKLETVGNIHSDGRPILGLDSRDLLEITLDICPEAIFIPAHIWTPHFSLFGAFSGFDTIEECFEDLTPHIHALETGLSSDPPMNWRVSALDGYQLVSNSDAHSPGKLGREANLLDTELGYTHLSRAIQQGQGLAGTLEFFPEEGKYHLDGHRKCNLSLNPSETAAYGGKCPVCGKKITIGVLHRVEELADREEGFVSENGRHYESLVPLTEVIAASTGKSSGSAKVAAEYESMLGKLGSEFSILRDIPLEDIRRAAGPCVEEGIKRLRSGDVTRIPGYDGEYGTVMIVSKDEIDELYGQISLFENYMEPAAETAASQASDNGGSGIIAASGLPKLSEGPENNMSVTEGSVDRSTGNEEASGMRATGIKGSVLAAEAKTSESSAALPKFPDGLNQEQYDAVTATDPVVAVIAGPGTGKTKTLVSRIAWLVKEQQVDPSRITAVTFTNKAAAEMRTRLEKELGGKRAVRPMTIGTFHSICLNLLKSRKREVVLADEYQCRDAAEQVIRQTGLKLRPAQLVQEISRLKNGLASEHILPDNTIALYQEQLEREGLMDFDDLLLQVLKMIDAGGNPDNQISDPDMEQALLSFSYLLVDEYQDINNIQYQLVRAWAKGHESLFVIGDPDQSIYGFRGSNAECFHLLKEQFTHVRDIRLTRNYRSAPEILSCALPVINRNPGENRILIAQQPSGIPVSLLTAESDLSEGIFIAKEINRMTGGIDMLDAQQYAIHTDKPRSFQDIAILYRTHRQAKVLESCLRKEGIPYVVTGRDDFLADETVRGVLAFFRFLLNPEDEASVKICLKNVWNYDDGLIGEFLDVLRQNQVKELDARQLRKLDSQLSPALELASCWQMVRLFLPTVRREKPASLIGKWLEANEIGMSEPLRRLLNMAVLHKDMPEFLQTLLLGQEGDLQRSADKVYASGAVTLMTLHGSKGLEFPVVFLCGVKKGCLPYESVTHPADPDEERRLFYVGMTRAREELIILTSREPSEFLEDIPEGCVEKGDVHKRKEGNAMEQLSLFDL